MSYQDHHIDPGRSDSGSRDSGCMSRLSWMLDFERTGDVWGVCAKYGISKKTFYKWLKRYRQSNRDAASLVDRSRRPHRFPRSTPESVVSLLRQVREETGYGQRRLRELLARKYDISISERTIWKILKRIEQSSAPGL